MRLHVLREPLLRPEEELDHGVGERVRVRAQRRDQAQQGAVERAVDLLQGRLACNDLRIMQILST